MRKFYLQNEKAERVDLNGLNGLAFADPSGLGLEYKRTYANVGDGFFNLVNTDEKQATPRGTLIFMQNPYAQYIQLTEWIAQAQELLLIYAPQNTEYYRRVDVNVLSKSEITAGTWMEVPITFACKTPWYLPVPVNLVFNSSTENNMVYTFRWTPQLKYSAGVGGAFTAQISPKGQIEGSIKLRFTGSIINPVITLTGLQTGTVYGEAAITASFDIGDTLELMTSRSGAYIQKNAADGTVTDLINYINVSNEPFFKIPLSEQTIIEIKSNNEIVGSASAELYYYYRTV